jgi:endonuclease/exonuclease/phosphatase family metal-dependent hydrolase
MQLRVEIYLLCLVICGSSAIAETPTRLRVLSYNIHHGEGTDLKVDLERIARVILSVKPDLIALQEVDQGAKRTDQVDQPATLAKLTKMEVVFGHNIPWEGGLYGNAVLSRFPILRSENHPLPSFYQGEQRGVLEVEIQTPNKESILLFATHLDYRRISEERLASARVINELVANRPSVPALLVGDLNAEPCSRPLLEFNKEWQRTNRRILPTYPVKCAYKQIDYVLVRPCAAWRVIETRVLGEQIASDHRPIFAVLEVRKREPAK